MISSLFPSLATAYESFPAFSSFMNSYWRHEYLIDASTHCCTNHTVRYSGFFARAFYHKRGRRHQVNITIATYPFIDKNSCQRAFNDRSILYLSTNNLLRAVEALNTSNLHLFPCLGILMFHVASTETYTHMHLQHQQAALVKKEHTSVNIKVVEFCRSKEDDASVSSVTSNHSDSTDSTSSTRKKWHRISQRIKLLQRQRQAQLEHRIVADAIIGSDLFCYDDFDKSSVSSLSLSEYDIGYNSSIECLRLDCRDCPTAIRVEGDAINQCDEERYSLSLMKFWSLHL